MFSVHHQHQQVLFHLPKLPKLAVYIKSSEKFSSNSTKKDDTIKSLQSLKAQDDIVLLAGLKDDIVLLARNLFQESISTKQTRLDTLFNTPKLNAFANVVNFPRTSWISAGTFELNKQLNPIISEYHNQFPASSYFRFVTFYFKYRRLQLILFYTVECRREVLRHIGH